MIVCGVVAALLAGCVGQEQEKSYGAEKADEQGDSTFFVSLAAEKRQAVLEALGIVVPIYLQESNKVLSQIDALAVGSVSEETWLNEVPMDGLFEAGQQALSQALHEADFEGGRRDHDVAWLRESAEELAELAKAVDSMLLGADVPVDFDDYLTNFYSWSDDTGDFRVEVGVRAVSRFYCNLDIRVSGNAAGVLDVIGEESCD